MDLLNQLQKFIGEFEKGKLYTIAARPGMGKTMFAKRIYKELKSIKEDDVLYIDTLLDTHIDKVGRYECMEYSKLKDIDSVVWEIKYSNAKIIVVDDYQMINKYNKNAADLFKQLAKMYDKTIIILSSISRKCDRRKDKHPQMKDMTKKICQSLRKQSDVVMFLYRENYYNPDIKENILEIGIVNNNATGVIKVDFKKLIGGTNCELD